MRSSFPTAFITATGRVAQEAPLPQAPIPVEADASVTRCEHRYPLPTVADAHEIVLEPVRARTKLAAIVVSPSPQRAITLQREEEIIACEHSRPV